MGRMKTTTLLSALAAAAAALLLAPGCADNLTGSGYSSSTARSTYVEQEGELLAVTPVTIEGNDRSSAGLLGGAILGAALGSTVGGGHGRTVATALGGVAGGVAGTAAEKAVTKQNGVELRVKLDDGRTVNVVQTLGNDTFVPGQRVRVLFGDDTRVRPL